MAMLSVSSLQILKVGNHCSLLEDKQESFLAVTSRSASKILMEWTLHLGILVFGTLRWHHLQNHLIHKLNTLGTMSGLTLAAFRSPYNDYSYRKSLLTEKSTLELTLFVQETLKSRHPPWTRDWLFHSKRQGLCIHQNLASPELSS